MYFHYRTLFIGLSTLGTLVDFDWLAHKVECSNVLSTNIIIYRRFNFVYLHLGCTSIYRRSLSIPGYLFAIVTFCKCEFMWKWLQPHLISHSIISERFLNTGDKYYTEDFLWRFPLSLIILFYVIFLFLLY